MAVSAIKSETVETVSSGTITRLTTNTGDFTQLNCIKKGNLVTVGAQVFNITASTALANMPYFQLPEGFRPLESIYVPAMIIIQGSTEQLMSRARVAPDGKVHCFDGSRALKSFFFSATYFV